MQKKMKNEKIQGVQAENMEREQETKEFLKQFYESPEAEEDTIAAKLKRTFVPKGKKTKAIADFAKDLMGEGGAGDVVIDDDMFEADTEGYKQQEKKRLSKRTRVSLFLLLVAIPLTIAAGFWLTDQSALADWIDRVFGPRKYYLISLVIVLYALLPFFMAFEGRKPEVRELVVLATMIALATAGRAAFFMTPSFKPIIAIVIISAIAFGAEAGFLVGSMTMLVSNFLFGQGPWTPWQMFAMGFIGFLSGILYRLRILPTKRLSGHLYDLRRDHEPGGTVYERISIQLERTACDLYLRCSGRSGACKLNLLVFVDRGEAAAGETAEDQGEVWVAVGKSKNSQWELYYRVLQF